MSFIIYLKDDIGNEISAILDEPIKEITVSTLSINDGLLKKGNYYIPLEHILFIKEV